MKPAEPLVVRKAAVIGAGVMGATIAAHFANAGVPVLLLDLRAEGDDPDARARAGRSGAAKAKPAAFFHREGAQLVEVGNTQDDLARLGECDWVVEAVIERLDIKAALFAEIGAHLKPGAVLSSNTSGLACSELTRDMAPELAARFAVTHFFNPPRYLRLLELVPGPQADPDLMARLAAFAERRLGKGIILAKDTPNFIANRIGMFGLMQSVHAMARHGLDIAEVDALTGPLLGRPPSATFRTADLVGLDTILHVAANLHERLTDDPQREVFAPPAFLSAMAEQGQLGVKTGAGFYRKSGPVIEVIDPDTLEYGLRPTVELDLPEGPPAAKLGELLARADRRGAFLREHLGAVLHYAASCVPEICDRIEDVDRAMRWGFGWRFGPFELWDMLGGDAGVPAFAARLETMGLARPPLIEALEAAGLSRFHGDDGTRPMVFVPGTGTAEALPERPRCLTLGRPDNRIAGTDEISLVDIGDDVACLQFHSKLNTLSPAMGAFVLEALAIVEERFAGLVIGNEANDFSAGANLSVVLAALADDDFDEVARLVDAFQGMTQAVRFLSRPVVVAPRGRTLGGACELLMHAHGACAAAESYIGLVEVGVGLIPGGGGCKEWVRRIDEEALPGAGTDLAPHLQRAFQAIGMAQVGTSAVESRALGYLRPDDPIVMNDEHLLHDARRRVLALAGRDHVVPVARDDLRVLGEDGFAALQVALFNLVQAGHATPHDAVVTTHVARILTGGGGRARRVSETRLLELEKEAFLSLCGEPATQARMKHTLTTGKPLRN